MSNCKHYLAIVLCMLIVLLQTEQVHASPVVKKDRAYYEERGDIVWESPKEDKVIAITFDDGPDPEDTPAILDLLKKYNGKATFFVVGKQLKRFPDIAKRQVEEGHELANHTFTHLYFNRSTPIQTIKNEIDQTQDLLYDITGTKTQLFRPPGGFYNDRMVSLCRDKGYLVVLWSWHQDTKDWDRPGVSKIVNKVLNNVRGGDIILMHDHVEGKSQTVAALEQILPELQKRGYRLVTVSELLGRSQPILSP